VRRGSSPPKSEMLPEVRNCKKLLARQLAGFQFRIIWLVWRKSLGKVRTLDESANDGEKHCSHGSGRYGVNSPGLAAARCVCSHSATCMAATWAKGSSFSR